MRFSSTVTVMGLLAVGIVVPMTVGRAQNGSATTPMPAPTAAPPLTREPRFSSGGISLTMSSVAISPDKRSVTVTAILTNEGPHDIKVSVLGDLRAVDDAGGILSVDARYIAGFSYCNAQDLLKNCVHDKAESGYEDYSEIDKGSSIVLPLQYQSPEPIKGERLSFNMKVAVVPVTDEDDSDPTASKKHAPPPRARIISPGIPLVPLPTH